MTPRVRQYVAEAAQRHGTTPEAVMLKRPQFGKGFPRPHCASDARREVMNRLRADGFTVTQVGRWFGVDHSTVSYWLRRSTA